MQRQMPDVIGRGGVECNQDREVVEVDVETPPKQLTAALKPVGEILVATELSASFVDMGNDWRPVEGQIGTGRDIRVK